MIRHERAALLTLAALASALVLSLVFPKPAAAMPFLDGSEPLLAQPNWILAHPYAGVGPAGFSPATMCVAYSQPCAGGAGKTVAIVDAYNDPTIASDLATFEHQFGITGCSLTVVNQHGGSHLPATDAGWALEISLDVEWVCAMAPSASVVLVEARSSTLTDLLAAEDYAAAHAQYVTNSWGAPEFASETHDDRHFNTPGVSFFAAAGDTGLGAQYPAASPTVLSVGGTTLTLSSGGAVSETGWSKGGGGCSVYEVANPAQVGHTDSVSCSGKRATPDVAFDADPASGVAVYDSTAYNGQSGWFQVGGTSVGSPVWAALSADAGGAVNAAAIYTLASSSVRDIIMGNNGAPCLTGYDLVTGRGSPLGTP